jgi:hypothetical protein
VLPNAQLGQVPRCCAPFITKKQKSQRSALAGAYLGATERLRSMASCQACWTSSFLRLAVLLTAVGKQAVELG